jgi:glucose-1-phosphate cytidylyltransferase
MKAVILCGGQGTRIQEVTGGLKPKPMVEVGGRPILWHIMKGYSTHGIRDFVLCLGHLGGMIKEFFLHYDALNSDFTARLGAKGDITYHRPHDEVDWQVTLADTGLDAMTGARLSRVRRYVGGETFMMTYGDGLADIDLRALLEFHREHGKIATVTGVNPVGRFGRLQVQSGRVHTFEEKPADELGGKINGGFLVLEPRVFDYLSDDPSCTLEREPMQRLATDGELMMYSHDGFWQCMDTYRDLLRIEQLWSSGHPPWRTWSSD